MLKQLELHNFRSHRSTQLNFDNSRLQAIVGQNSSGKTSILQALYYLGQVSELNFGSFSQYQEKMPELVKVIAENVATIRSNHLYITGIGVQEVEDGETWQLDCEFHKGNDNDWSKEIAWRINGNEIKDLQLYKSMIFGGIYEPPDLKFIAYLKLVSSNLIKASYSENITPEVALDGSGLAPTLDYLRSEAPDRFQLIQEMLKQIVPGVRKVGIRRAKVKIDRQRSIAVDGKSIAYEESQEVTGQEIVLDMNTGDRIPAHAISEGTMLTLGLLTVLMNPKQPNLVLLDDIEQGLHPKAQRELITVFKQIIQANPNLQIIFTTHSPYIVDELEPSQVHVLSNSKSGFTRAKRLDEHPDAEWAKQTLTTGEFWNAEGEDWVVDGDVND